MKKAYLFSGQGSQYIGMEKIFENYTNISNHFFTKSEETLCKFLNKYIKKETTLF